MLATDYCSSFRLKVSAQTCIYIPRYHWHLITKFLTAAERGLNIMRITFWQRSYSPVLSLSCVCNLASPPINLFLSPPPLQACKFWRTLRPRRTKPRLNKALHQSFPPLFQHFITLRYIIDGKAVGEHNRWIHLSSFHPVKDVFPVFVHGGLPAPDHFDAALHDGADVEVISVYQQSATHPRSTG